MSSFRWMSPMRRVSFLWVIAAVAAASASAQSSPSPNRSGSALFMAGESSSNEFHFASDDGLSGAPALSSAAALLAKPAVGASGGGAGQADEGGRGWKHSLFGHGFAMDLGAGFNAPIGNATSSAYGGPFITWGGNLTAGAGLHFSRRLSLLGEFQYMDNKLPGAFIAEAGGQTGNAHIVSITADPVVDLFPKLKNGIYLTGGGGYYHKSTNFNVVECCDEFGGGVPVTVNSFSSDQLGGNIGFGISRRLGGVYGDGTMKLFGEARYTYINTPKITETNGLGRTELIPVTFGVRW